MQFLEYEYPPYPIRDVSGMLLLHKLSPVTGDMVSAAEHDQIWFAADPEMVASNATEDDILNLLRCGILYEDGEGFYTFT